MSMLKPATLEDGPKKQDKPKKEKKVKTEIKPEETTEAQERKKEYKYPFEIYLAAEKRDVSYIFADGQVYTEDQITKAMLEHGFYEFAGNVKYDYIKDDNVLVPVFQQHKKG